jgi:HAD superfamily hydrolase (TIGR01509 family)
VIRAVTFDFWETLVSEGAGIDAEEDGTMRTRQVRRWSEILGVAGFPVGLDAIDTAFDRNWEVFHESWRTNVQHGPEDATPLVCELLGVDPLPEVRAALLASFDEVGLEAPLRLAPGIEDCIGRLKDAGVLIGIICDVGMTASPTLRDRLDMFGVLRYFDHWSFSDEVGCFKPWPALFEHALAGLGVEDPASAAHVGDSRRTDVAGAQAMGMTAVRYTYFVDAPAETGPEAQHVLDDHANLAAALEIS